MNKKEIIKRQEAWDKVVVESSSLSQAVMRNDNQISLKNTSQYISDKLDLNKTDTLLDVGCGTGVLTNELSHHVKDAYGVDFSHEAIQRAKAKFHEIKFSVSESINLPFPENSFDKILSYSIFHYYPSKSYAEASISEMLRVSKSKSTLLFGDLPSEKHYLSSSNKKKLSFLSLTKKRFKRFLGLKKRPIIQDRRSWFWIDLEYIKSYLESKGCEIEISPVPSIHQYTEKTSHYRFDILVKK